MYFSFVTDVISLLNRHQHHPTPELTLSIARKPSVLLRQAKQVHRLNYNVNFFFFTKSLGNPLSCGLKGIFFVKMETATEEVLARMGNRMNASAIKYLHDE